jgi:hypothetical protein
MFHVPGFQLRFHELHHLIERQMTEFCDDEQLFDGELFYAVDEKVESGAAFPQITGNDGLFLIVEDIQEPLDLPFIQHRFNDVIPLIRFSHTQRKDIIPASKGDCRIFTFNRKIIHLLSAIWHFFTAYFSVFVSFIVSFWGLIGPAGAGAGFLPGFRLFVRVPLAP